MQPNAWIECWQATPFDPPKYRWHGGQYAAVDYAFLEWQSDLIRRLGVTAYLDGTRQRLLVGSWRCRAVHNDPDRRYVVIERLTG